MLLEQMKYYTVKDDPQSIIQQLRVQWTSTEMQPCATSLTKVSGSIKIVNNDTRLIVTVTTTVNDVTYSKDPVYVKKYGVLDVPFVVEEDSAYKTDDKYFMVEDAIVVNDIYYYIINTNGVFCILNGPLVDTAVELEFEIWPFNIIIPTHSTKYTTLYPVVTATALSNAINSEVCQNKTRDEIKDILQDKLIPTSEVFDNGSKFIDSDDATFVLNNQSVVISNKTNTIEQETERTYISYINGKQLHSGSLYFTFELKAKGDSTDE